jgi:hypothetical protein
MPKWIAGSVLSLAIGVLPFLSGPSVADAQNNFLTPYLTPCTNGAWPYGKIPETEADWETIIKSAKLWHAQGRSPDDCIFTIVLLYAEYAEKKYPDKVEVKKHVEEVVGRMKGPN